MVSSAEKYREVVSLAKRQGYETSISVDKLRSCIMERMAVKDNFYFKFHIKNMEDLGLIKLMAPGLWEIIE